MKVTVILSVNPTPNLPKLTVPPRQLRTQILNLENILNAKIRSMAAEHSYPGANIKTSKDDK